MFEHTEMPDYTSYLYSGYDRIRKQMEDPFAQREYMANPKYKAIPIDREPRLREFIVQGYSVMARNHKDAIKTLVKKGLIKDKKDKKKKK